MMLRLAPITLVALLVLPVTAGLAMVLLPAFGYLPVIGHEQLSLAPWQQLLAQPGLGRSVLVSLFSGLASTALALLVVVLFLAASQGTWLDRSLRRWVSPLLSIPHAAVAFGFAFLIAPSGLTARLFSPWLTGWESPPDALVVNDPWGVALTLGLVLKEAPFLLLMSLAALPQLQPEKRLRLARSLGYTPVIGWLKVVLPSLYPLIRLPVYAVIAYATSVVDMALILGPRLPPTLSVSILGWFNDPDITRRLMASAAAVLQLGVTVLALLLWWLMEQGVRWSSRGWLVNGSRQRGATAVKIAGRGGLTLVTVAALAALAGLALFSVAGFWRFPELFPQALTLDHWQRSAPQLAGPLRTTLAIAVVSTGVAALLVVAALEHEQRQQIRPSRALWLLYLPLLVPQIAFLFGLIVAAESLGIRPQLALVMVGHLLFVLPYLYLSLAEAYRQLDPRWIHMAQSLGVTPNRAFWRVRLPLLLAPLLTSLAVGLAVSISQYLPTQLLGAGRVSTVTTEAVALASGGNRRLIGVWALVQAVLPLAGFMLALAIPRWLGVPRSVSSNEGAR
ncbi:ABC transporter permease [Vreelandella hamiltonii]|uniref:ABC transporter permease n=1 Tax=Halomonas johnsoniae TaxID=502832 RepID=A0ABQ2WMP2_9GAMM|nr:ABC transporter permease subunit [Halomonas johnsoniae]GGW63045.1 ABC transporter permease [Halomonas johnsoniae]